MNSTVETEIRQREGNRSNCLSYHMYDIYVGIIGSFNVIDYAVCSLFMIRGIQKSPSRFSNFREYDSPQYITHLCK